jgi:glycosyltransferase involved in cell wall biosynthesis
VRVSCIIPAWNEAARIGGVLAVVAGHPDLAEVIVVDDGSTDGCAERAEAVAAQAPKLRVIRLGANRGKTHAVAVGVAAAAHDWLLLLDADLQGLSAAAVAALVAPVRQGRADAAISLRCNAPWPWRHVGLDFISGERVLPRAILDPATLQGLPRFGLEVHVNRALIERGLRLAVVPWPQVRSPLKSEKQGRWRGWHNDLRMVRDIFDTIPVHHALRQIWSLRRLAV